jgi:hypothetical protein
MEIDIRRFVAGPVGVSYYANTVDHLIRAEKG